MEVTCSENPTAKKVKNPDKDFKGYPFIFAVTKMIKAVLDQASDIDSAIESEKNGEEMILISDILIDSKAYKSGIEPGDEIIAIDDKELKGGQIHELFTLDGYVAFFKPANKKIKVKVKKPYGKIFETMLDGGDNPLAPFGIELRINKKTQRPSKNRPGKKETLIREEYEKKDAHGNPYQLIAEFEADIKMYRLGEYEESVPCRRLKSLQIKVERDGQSKTVDLMELSREALVFISLYDLDMNTSDRKECIFLGCFYTNEGIETFLHECSHVEQKSIPAKNALLDRYEYKLPKDFTLPNLDIGKFDKAADPIGTFIKKSGEALRKFDSFEDIYSAVPQLFSLNRTIKSCHQRFTHAYYGILRLIDSRLSKFFIGGTNTLTPVMILWRFIFECLESGESKDARSYFTSIISDGKRSSPELNTLMTEIQKSADEMTDLYPKIKNMLTIEHAEFIADIPTKMIERDAEAGMLTKARSIKASTGLQLWKPRKILRGEVTQRKPGWVSEKINMHINEEWLQQEIKDHNPFSKAQPQREVRPPYVYTHRYLVDLGATPRSMKIVDPKGGPAQMPRVDMSCS